jgi:hypothetical protein
MRESRTYGSVRGALSNERPYRDRLRLAMTEVKSHADQNEAAYETDRGGDCAG